VTDGPGPVPATTAPEALAVSTAVGEWGEQDRASLDAAQSANIHRAYRGDWQHFAAWCADHDRMPLPAASETLAPYLTRTPGY
jgi:hypothetical protein